MKSIIGLVTGTYNRRHYLALMIASFREQVPKGIPYTITVIDGGSTDGTLEWCERQRDIQLIRDGRLTGAISAFSRAAEATDAENLIFANDDIVFHMHSIPCALRYLETHLSCAAIAFRDNRTSIVTGDGSQYRSEGMGATLADGTRTMVTYMQVGMVRKTLAEQAGYWGYKDELMSQARTYAGDNFLSSQLWEMGYTVDDVEGCSCDDLIVRDELRNINGSTGANDSALYYQRYPTVNIPPHRARVELQDRLRVLLLLVYEAGYPQAANHERKWTEALQDRGALVLEIDYLNTKTDIPRVAKAWQPDLVIAQIQGWGEKMTPQILADMRKAAPHAVVVSWNGDAHLRGLIESPMLDLYQHVDLVTTVNAAALPILEAKGVRAVYWQIGYTPPDRDLPDVFAYDVLAQMNWYEYREPLFELLYDLPYFVGVYGNDRRANGTTHYDFTAQAALYAAATITVGDTFPFDTRAFMSNRVLQCLGAGGFLLLQHSEALEEYTGLRVGVHYAMWTDLEDLRQKIDYWLQPENAKLRGMIAATGKAFVREHFSFDAQIDKLLSDLIPMIGQREPVEIWADGIPR